MTGAATPGSSRIRKPAVGEAPATDARLRQKVYVHATNQRLADVLAGLTKATGVTLVAHPEVADEQVSYWANDRPLLDVMRDLRHLRGYFWSRAKRSGGYVYSLWQDAQSRSREEAEIQRMAIRLQREFAGIVQQRVRALGWGEADLKRAAQSDPYLVAQMLHPVLRAGYQLFAALSADQQAQLLQGQEPSGGTPIGIPLHVMPLEPMPGLPGAPPVPGGNLLPKFGPAGWTAPRGDVVTLTWDEMNGAQRAAIEAMFAGGQKMQERAARLQPPSPYGNPYDNFVRALKSADRATAVVSIFRCGDPAMQALNLRVAFRSAGRQWALDSNLAASAEAVQSYNKLIRSGEFRLWPGCSEDLRPYLVASPKDGAGAAPRPDAPPASRPPDPVLDAPVSLSWPLPVRGGRPVLFPDEVLAALQSELRRPLVLDPGYPVLDQPRGAPPEFQWRRLPLRSLLHRILPGWQASYSGGTIFLRDPNRLKDRLNQVPPAVERMLSERKVPLTLDDMAVLARSLTPWQITKLSLPGAGTDETLAAYELLRLYGELAPAQRAALDQEVAFSSLTPPQQFLFLRMAQRQRPFVEPWRFQHATLSLRSEPVPPRPFSMRSSMWPVARQVFRVQFQEDDAERFPVDLFGPRELTGWMAPPSGWVGQPFPFSVPSLAPEMDQMINPGWTPALAASRLRHRLAVILISRPFADPYAGVRPPPSTGATAAALSRRLRDTGALVVNVILGPAGAPAESEGLIMLREPGDTNGQPFDSVNSGARIERAPTVFVVDRDEIVRAVFEGQAAGDTATIESAVRRAAAAAAPSPP